VLEIGPGHGILTRELLKIADTVVAIEKDPILVSELQKTFSKEIERKKLILIEEDIRNFEPSDCTALRSGYVLVANIPYYITGYIIRLFLTSKHQPKAIAVLLQKEVAERIVARDKKHSLLSLSVHAFGTPTLKKIVKAGAFSPQPKVDSAILTIENISRSHFLHENTEKYFFEIIKTAFSQKRKTLGATLKKKIPPEIFDTCEIDKKTRPEDVSLLKWFCVTQNH
jgi:16S rRNA (adenine1518-N6/adenine1519-N6)-dimethyltransferase